MTFHLISAHGSSVQQSFFLMQARKAEADADVRKAEADAEARKAEANAEACKA